MSKLIVFDVDGTFLDSISFFEEVIGKYSREQGLPPPDIEAIKHGYGAPHEHDFGWGVSKDEQLRHLNGSFDLLNSYEKSGIPHLMPDLFGGVEESLVHMKDLGHTLAIITSKPEEALLQSLARHGVDGFFSAYRAYDDIKRRNEKEKPAPDMLHSVMRELKFVPDETVMVGDTTMDIRMGRAAGAGAIGVTWGAHPKEHLVKAGAHHIVETGFNEVVHAVQKIFE